MKKLLILSLLFISTTSFSMMRNTARKLTSNIFNVISPNSVSNPFFQERFQECASEASTILIATYVFCHPEIMIFLKKAHLRGAYVSLFLGNTDYGCFETNSDDYKTEFKALGISFEEFAHWNPRNQGCGCYFNKGQESILLQSSSNISTYGLNNDAMCQFTNDPKELKRFIENFDDGTNRK